MNDHIQWTDVYNTDVGLDKSSASETYANKNYVYTLLASYETRNTTYHLQWGPSTTVTYFHSTNCAHFDAVIYANGTL